MNLKNSVEIAKSDRAKCSECKGRIAGGEKRVAVQYPYYNRVETRYLCKVCGFNEFKKELARNFKHIKALDVNPKDFKNFKQEFDKRLFGYMENRLSDKLFQEFKEGLIEVEELK